MRKVRGKKHGLIGSTVRGAIASCLLVSAAVIGLLSTNRAQVQTCTPPPPNMVSWWPGDGNANDIQGSNNGTLLNGATFPTGEVGQAFSFDGTNDFVDVPTSNGLPTSTWTIDFWFFLNTNTTSQAFVTNFDGSGSRYVIELFVSLGLRIGHFTSGVPDLNSFVTPSANAWHHLAAIQSTDPNIGQLLYLDGNLIGYRWSQHRRPDDTSEIRSKRGW